MFSVQTDILLLIVIMCVACTMLINHFLHKENVPTRLRRSYVKQFISLWIGISVAVICYFYLSSSGTPLLASPVTTVQFLESDGTLNNQSDHLKHLSSDEKPIIFITTTDYSVTQVASLTRIGQAIFPVRDKVLWIVVALPLETSPNHQQIVDPTWKSFGDSISYRRDVSKRHFQNLQRLITRFGVPFVLLAGYGDHNELSKNMWLGYRWPNTADRILRGYETGLLWATKNIHRGVIVLGEEEYVYNSALFAELHGTKIASCWPVGLMANNAAITIPIFAAGTGADNNAQKTVIGYVQTDYRNRKLGSVRIERGAFAIDLHHLRTYVPIKNHWKISLDRAYTNSEIKIPLKDILAMGNGSRQIYVWRTETGRVEWPNSIKVVKNVLEENTNVKRLLETTFGPRYYVMKELIRVKAVDRLNIKDYQDYDMKVVSPYMNKASVDLSTLGESTSTSSLDNY